MCPPEKKSLWPTFRLNKGGRTYFYGYFFIHDFYQILLDDSDTTIANKLCFASTDPRMETFDGQYWTAQLPGEFVLYRDKQRRIAVSLKRTNIVSPQIQRIKFLLIPIYGR